MLLILPCCCTPLMSVNHTIPPHSLTVRPLRPDDRAAWQPLWDGYNAFYEREIPWATTEATWARFFDPTEPLFGLVAQAPDGSLLGLTHYLWHRSTALLEPICYLEDLYTLPQARKQGVARALIEAVYAAARVHGVRQVYWQTHESNQTAQALYRQLATNEGFLVYSRHLG